MKQKPTSTPAPYLNTVLAREKKRKRKLKFRWFWVLSLISLFCMGFLVFRFWINKEAPPLTYQPLSLAEANPDQVRSIFQAGDILIIHSTEPPTSPDTLHNMADYYRYSRSRYLAPDSP